MKDAPPASGPRISADMQVMDVIYRHRSTEAVFKAYEAETGHCICCEALFESVGDAAARYGLDLERLLQRLEEAAAAE